MLARRMFQIEIRDTSHKSAPMATGMHIETLLAQVDKLETTQSP